MGSSKTTYSPTTRSLAGGPTVESSILARAIPPLWSVRTSLPRARELPAPRFVIVIGANGAGKSTWCRAHQEELPSNFYDADSIAQGLGSYDDSARQLEARALVDAHIDQHLEQNDSFGFESTYSGASRPRIARRASELGYATYAIFVGTRDPSINIDRVAARVRARTGHHVPQSEIRRRWTAAQENLVKTVSLFDRIRILDNSDDHVWTVADYVGRGQRHRTVEAPPWVARLSAALIRGHLPGRPTRSRL